MSLSEFWVFYYHEVDREKAGDIVLLKLNSEYGNTKDILDKDVTDKIVKIFIAKKFPNTLAGVMDSLNWMKGHLKVVADQRYSSFFINNHTFFVERKNLPEKITKESQHLRIRQKVLPNHKIVIGNVTFEDSKNCKKNYLDSLILEAGKQKTYNFITSDLKY